MKTALIVKRDDDVLETDRVNTQHGHMDFAGKSAEQILQNSILDSSSWHFFQAQSWLDYAQRTQLPSAIHYSAFELRYGIEYLLFELLMLANGELAMADYKRCLGNPSEMKKMLKTLGTNYYLLTEFTEAALSLDSAAPKLRYWEIGELFRYWGIASEYLHFVGAQQLTYREIGWLGKAIARLNEPLEKLWESVTETVGEGVLRPSKMPPEVHAAWIDFSSGALSKSDLIMRLKLIQPVLELRRASQLDRRFLQ